MSCTCELTQDFDGPSVLSRTVQKARRPYRCCECREIIPIGAPYVRDRGLWDGQWSTYRTCVACDRVRREHCACAPYGSLREYLRDGLDLDYLDPTWEPRRR